jgi:hypothetical protein
MVTSAANRFIHVDVTISNLDVEAAGRIGADPRLVMDRGAPSAKIGQRHQISRLALLAFRQSHFHPTSPHTIAVTRRPNQPEV